MRAWRPDARRTPQGEAGFVGWQRSSSAKPLIFESTGVRVDLVALIVTALLPSSDLMASQPTQRLDAVVDVGAHTVESPTSPAAVAHVDVNADDSS